MTIVEYYWYSSIDRFLSNKKSFNSTNLSNGTHTIIFKIQDNNGTWSDVDSEKLIINGKPGARIVSITPNPALNTETIHFMGNGTDDGMLSSFCCI